MSLFKVIHIPYDPNPYQQLLLDHLKIFRLHSQYGKTAKISSTIDISLLSNFIRNFRVHIIHLHWHHQFLLADGKVNTIIKSFLFICQLMILKICGTKLVWTVHNLKHHETKHKDLERFFSKILAQFADVIIAHCEMAKREIEKTFHVKKVDKIAVIPIGKYDIYQNTMSREEARKTLGISPEDFIFLYLGRIRPYKGLLELIDTFEALEKPYAKIIIAGKPKYEKFIEVLLKKVEGNSNIRLILRFIPDDDIQKYMNAADAITLPFRDVLSTSSVLLGMSFAKPIIAPNLGCIPDLLDSAGSFVYPHNGQGALLKAMKAAIDSRGKLQEMGQHNWALAQRLDWRNIATETFRVYESCLRTRGQ